jgi:hypothetical protein
MNFSWHKACSKNTPRTRQSLATGHLPVLWAGFHIHGFIATPLNPPGPVETERRIPHLPLDQSCFSPDSESIQKQDISTRNNPLFSRQDAKRAKSDWVLREFPPRIPEDPPCKLWCSLRLRVRSGDILFVQTNNMGYLTQMDFPCSRLSGKHAGNTAGPGVSALQAGPP